MPSRGAAPRIYICNVATQPGETDGYTRRRPHAPAARTRAMPSPSCWQMTISTTDNLINLNTEWVSLPAPDEALDYQLFTGDLVESARPWRHDPHKLAQRLIELYEVLRTHS